LPEIQNPNLQSQGSGGSGGGDMRSTMAFMLLAMAVIFGYQFFFMKPQPVQQPPAQTQTQSAAPSASAAPGQSPAATVSAPAQAPAATPQIAASMETTTTVENQFFKIVFSNRGGQVKSWTLKKYFDSAGKPLDLVQPQAAARFGLPLSFFTYEPALNTELNGALYQVSYSGAQPTATGLLEAPAAITFHYAANGVDAVKTFRFDTSYVVTVETQVKRNGSPVRALVQWPAGLGDMEELKQSGMMPSQARTPSFFAWSINGKSDSQAATKVSGNNTLDEPYQYAAVMDLYFAAAFLPDAPDRTTVVTLHNAIDLPSNPGDPNGKQTAVDVLGLAVGDTSGVTRLRLFAGPKATDLLQSIHATGADGKPSGPSLDPLIQFGFWAFIAKPLYLILRFLVSHGIPNWGWAIIFSTVILNLTLLPTRVTAMKSSLKMMRIQPKLDAIKKRYANLKANDPKKMEMQQEQMALMKAEGVNMYGSCLPMLVPMLLLWPYFRVLLNAVELRQAHWLWLPDLSQPDPTHILPIVIIITMFLMQYITPSPGMDPAQRRMMAIMMPMIFGFMLWHYASGLALYWGTGNVIGLVMQICINRSHWGREMHAIAARRAAKKGR
jgi:YidC/Oxa1 family membrane protein insertase